MERLIEKYMSLPNQAWDNIVKEATRVSSSEAKGWFVQSCLARIGSVKIFVVFHM